VEAEPPAVEILADRAVAQDVDRRQRDRPHRVPPLDEAVEPAAPPLLAQRALQGKRILVRHPEAFVRFFVRIEAEGCRTRPTVGAGSFVENGRVLTVAHVVAGSDHVDVFLSNGAEVDARVVAIDRDKDLAVLAVDADAPEWALRYKVLHLPALAAGTTNLAFLL